MLAEPPSLRFQPKFYTGGANRFYLPLLYDLVVTRRPRVLVVLGFGDGQAHFTLCQAAREHAIECRCLGVHRDDGTSGGAADNDWQRGLAESDEFYADVCELVAGPQAEALAQCADGSVDVLLLDDCDAYDIARAELEAWRPKLAPGAVVLVHGTLTDRRPPLRQAFEDASAHQAAIHFDHGLGLGVFLRDGDVQRNGGSSWDELFTSEERLHEAATMYGLIAERIDAAAERQQALRENAALRSRQIWLDSVLGDRMKAQEIMDHQGREIAALKHELAAGSTLREQFQALRRDRAKAQLVMDTQAEQLKRWTTQASALDAERIKLKERLADLKARYNSAKSACRKNGSCFHQAEPGVKKERRSVTERVARELKRIPRKVTALWSPAPPPAAKPDSNPAQRQSAADRYESWIATHEPDAAALDRQRSDTAVEQEVGTISLLVPVYNTPAAFLQAMFASVAAQTYANWELCVVDGGSSDSATLEVLRRWESADARVRVERLEQNLGVAENTNRALAMAQGRFVGLLDHDDVLAPFALYEIARALRDDPQTDILYSDEDRLSTDGERHSPFFKPEWSPELLLSSMYIGHLTAYRTELMRSLGGFRKEFDLSQDYDLALRTTEVTSRIRHVPHVLYHWREHPASGASGGKPHARKTNLAALDQAMTRRNLSAEILEYPTANRARLKISEWPTVSIIVPTDSAERARACVADLPRATKYPRLEIVVVTNSGLATLLEDSRAAGASVRLVRYDKPFNFSDKCNEGAKAATGQRLIFFNDDVEPQQADWIQELIEPLENPEIGAVSPKLLYANGKIQHAGLVTGVRGFIGTACHQWPGDSPDYTNFAQSMRDVSALSGACLAMRRDDLFAVGEWDAVDTPVAHSDLDLCFKIRAAGLRCVYTPFVTMTHRGHVSIGSAEEEEEEKPGPAEKISIFLLKRWPEYTTHDPYFPDNVRDWLYADSPTPIRMWAGPAHERQSNRGDLLFVSHDLSWSGAPLILLHLSGWLRSQGFFVTMMSPQDGPLRSEFVKAGIPLIVDPLITTGHESFTNFAREFDCVIASTIFGAPIVRAAHAAAIPHLWWIHEGRVAEHYLDSDAGLRAALPVANLIVTPDTRSSHIYLPFTDRPMRILTYGIPEPQVPLHSNERHDGRLKFLLLGTIEERKGQKVLVEALRQLPAATLEKIDVQIVGRAHDPEIAQEIKAAVREIACLSYADSVTHEEALSLIAGTDVMLSASWDETGPLILIEALALGRAIVSTSVGGVAEHLVSEGAGLFFAPGDATALAEAIRRLVDEPALVRELTAKARSAYIDYFVFDRFGGEFIDLVNEAIELSRAGHDPTQRSPEKLEAAG